MLRKTIVSAILAVAALTAVSARADKPGQVARQHYAVNMGDFGQLRVIDVLNVEYRSSADSAGYVVFDCEPDIAPLILVSNDKFTLRLQAQTDVPVMPRLPKITVYSTYLSSAENSGDSTLWVTNPAPNAELKLRVVGNGHIICRGIRSNLVEGKIDTGRGTLYMAGAANWAKLRTVGTGSIQAGALKAEKGSIFIGGTGSVDCWITGELTVTGLGSGKVYLKGTPKVKNRTLGTVKVVSMDQPAETPKN